MRIRKPETCRMKAALGRSEGMNIMLNYLQMERDLKIKDLQIQQLEKKLEERSVIKKPVQSSMELQ